MKSGICPKCGGREVYRHTGNKFGYEAITLKGGVVSKDAAPDKYLCVNCGHLEYYLPVNEKDIQLVRDNWERVAVE